MPADVIVDVELRNLDDLDRLEVQIEGISRRADDINVGVSTAGANRELNRTEGEVEDIRAEANDIPVSVDTDQARRGLSGLLDQFGGLRTLGPAAVGAAGGAALIKIGTDAFNSAIEIGRLADATLVSTDRIQALQHIANATGADIEAFTDGQRELGIRLGEVASHGTGPAVDALTSLGLTFDDVADKSPAEQMDFLVGRLLRVEDTSERAFLAEELLGGQFAENSRVLGLSAEEYANYARAAEESRKISSGNIEAIENLNNTWQSFRQTVLVVVSNGIGVAIDAFGVLRDAVEIAWSIIRGVSIVTADLVVGALTWLADNVPFVSEAFELASDVVSLAWASITGIISRAVERSVRAINTMIGIANRLPTVNIPLIELEANFLGLGNTAVTTSDQIEEFTGGIAQLPTPLREVSAGVEVLAQRELELAEANAAVAQSFRDVAVEAGIARQAVLRGLDRAFQTGDIEGTFAQAPGLQSSASAPRQRSGSGGGYGRLQGDDSRDSTASDQEEISRLFGRAVAQGLDLTRDQIELAFFADSEIQQDQAARLAQLETGMTEVQSLLDAARQEARDAAGLARDSARAQADQAHLDATTLAGVQRYQAMLAQAQLQEQRQIANELRQQRADLAVDIAGVQGLPVERVAELLGSLNAPGDPVRNLQQAANAPGSQSSTQIILDNEVLGEFVTREVNRQVASGTLTGAL